MKHWAVVPFIDCWENTRETVWDLLCQTIPVNILLIDNGSDLAVWNEAREWASNPRSLTENWTAYWNRQDRGSVFPWRHNPSLPSLSATWNSALDFVWASGGEEAMVCNNDIRLRPWMYEALLGAKYDRSEKPLFVSGVNSPAGYDKWAEMPTMDDVNKGGPDFSCYLITKEGHTKYRFDENFVPAYNEDLDMHRRYMLGGDGARIFSVNLPYLHKDNGSGTLKSFSEARARAFHTAVETGSRSYYRAKWGGGANEETFLYPFNPVPDEQFEKGFEIYNGLCSQGCVTTPQLQQHGCRGGRSD